MPYAINIETTNAAFDAEPRAEVVRILRDLADFLDNGGAIPVGEALILRDINGNRVGKAHHNPPRVAMSPYEEAFADVIEAASWDRYEAHRQAARRAAFAMHDLFGWGFTDDGSRIRFTRSHAEQEGED